MGVCVDRGNIVIVCGINTGDIGFDMFYAKFFYTMFAKKLGEFGCIQVISVIYLEGLFWC